MKALIVKDDGLIYAAEVPEEPIKTEYEHYYDVAWLTTLDLHRRAVQSAKESAVKCSDQDVAAGMIVLQHPNSMKYRGSYAVGIKPGIYPIPDLQWEVRYLSCRECPDSSLAMPDCCHNHPKVAILKESTPSTESQDVSYNEYLEAVGTDDNNAYARKIYERLIHNGFTITRKP